MKNIFILITLLTTTTFFSACKKANDEPAPETGTVHVEFDNQFEQDALDPEQYTPLVFNTKTYQNAAGEDYTITKFKYYISNVVLKKADGSTYAVPESYYLIDASSSTDQLLTLSHVPAGNYTGMSYIIGVDSARNVSGAQTGALAETNGMFWTWNTGYIFMMFEGTSPQSTATDHVLQYHVGGFRNSTNTNALKTVNLSFGSSTLRVTKVGIPQVHIMVEASKVAKNRSFAITPTVQMAGAKAIEIADDYVNMFSFDHIHN
ncbi:MAG: hypothetical protein H7282_08725 [Cytophagaceae bacterium]|nr:hypothetical protein [Cytophagaceae bacterium]